MKTSSLGWTPPIRAPVPTKVAVPMLHLATTTSSPTISSGPTPATGSPPPGNPLAIDDIARRVTEARRRVADAQTKLAVKDNPYMVIVSLCSPYHSISLIRWFSVVLASEWEKESHSGANSAGRWSEDGCPPVVVGYNTCNSSVQEGQV